jgi:uncharacterized protein involved in exopolysaccharide biosynthesis
LTEKGLLLVPDKVLLTLDIQGESMQRRLLALVLSAAVLGAAGAAIATETITYTYDAKGRLVKVVHSGTVNNNVQVEYTHDKADNRTNVKTTGASN